MVKIKIEKSHSRSFTAILEELKGRIEAAKLLRHRRPGFGVDDFFCFSATCK